MYIYQELFINIGHACLSSHYSCCQFQVFNDDKQKRESASGTQQCKVIHAKIVKCLVVHK